MRCIGGLAFIVGLALWAPANSAFLKSSVNKEGGVLISDGDARAFKAAVKSGNNAGRLASSSITITPQPSFEPRQASPITWESVFDKAIALSGQQHGGKPMVVRSCQPELKTCFSVVVYKDSKGTDSALKVTTDMSDKIIRREACTFNKSGDFRRCFDWDNEVMRHELQDSKGNWYEIE